MKISSLQQLLKIFYKSMGLSSFWSSSALDLDDALVAAGYKLPKFFHNYKLPIAKEALEQESNKMLMFSYPNYFIPKMEKILGEKIEIAESLDQELEQIKKDMIETINNLTERIKNQNPDLKDIKTPGLVDKVHFIRGAIYGYPPENIKFWIENYPNDNVFNESFEPRRELKEKFRIDVGLMRLTKKQAQDLLAEVEQQLKTKNKFYTSRSRIQEKSYMLDDFGREDTTGFLRFMQEREDDI